ncbi:MAG: glucose-6-phosphate isomerase [Colwellia sp.]|jgi:glucose-6-phosphate isomerase
MLTNSLAWQNLQIHYLDSKIIHLKSLFRIDPERFDKFTRTAAGLTLDYSKNHLVPETKNLLVDLAKQCGVDEKI